MKYNLIKKFSFCAIHAFFAASLFFPVTTFAQSKPAAVTSPAATQTTAETTTGSGSTDSNFVPLTQLPGVGDISKADNFSDFLNTFYKILIGLGATLAVIMIMVAGVMFMTSSGSVQGNEKAKSYISNAILGLVLILTPTIVFGIINPSILNINIGSQFAKLQTKLDEISVNSPTGTFSGADTYLWQNTSPSAKDAANCKASGGTLQQACGVKADGSGGTNIPTGGTCLSGKAKVSICKASATVPTTGNSCNDMYAKKQAYPIDQAPGYCVNPSVSAPHGCCVGSNAQNTLCCATPKGAATAPESSPDISTPPTPTAATGYGWALYVVPRGKTTPESLASKGPFATSQQCTASLSAFFNENNVDQSGNKAPLCTCSAKIKDQPGCPVK